MTGRRSELKCQTQRVKSGSLLGSRNSTNLHGQHSEGYPKGRESPEKIGIRYLPGAVRKPALPRMSCPASTASSLVNNFRGIYLYPPKLVGPEKAGLSELRKDGQRASDEHRLDPAVANPQVIEDEPQVLASTTQDDVDGIPFGSFEVVTTH